MSRASAGKLLLEEDSSSELPSITDTQTDREESDRVNGSEREGGMREK